MEKIGVAFHYERQFFDAPTLAGGVAESLNDPGRFTILDVGGNDTGARLIGGFSKLLDRDGTLVLYVVNPYRPWSKDTASIDRTLSAILQVSHLRHFSIISNPNLGFETTAEEFAAGIESTRQMLERHGRPHRDECPFAEQISLQADAGRHAVYQQLHCH